MRDEASNDGDEYCGDRDGRDQVHEESGHVDGMLALDAAGVVEIEVLWTWMG